MTRTLHVGARGSRLSMWQVHHAIDMLQRRGVPADLVVLSSSGDRDRSVAIEELPCAAPFADDLEDALKAGTIDVAVHSLKDLALVPPAGLVVGALLPRGSVTESLVSRDHIRFDELPPGSVIGTCSSRRQAQVHRRRPDLVCRPIRGPVDDRVDQVRAGEFDAAILATAGLERLGLSDAITEIFSASDFVPAAGQGALALQVREADAEARAVTASLDHFATRLATTAELAAERHLDAAGQLAAAYAFVQHAFITLHVRVLPRDGSDAVDVMASGTDPDRVALDAADRALERIYGPFREAAGSSPQFGNRRGYQLDPANARQAVEEARLDVTEGADMLMVKPALPYLDVIARVRAAEPGLPLVAYQVSGEYSMLKAAAANGWTDEVSAVDETLTAIKRAGADVIITYFAVDAARRLAHAHS